MKNRVLALFLYTIFSMGLVGCQSTNHNSGNINSNNGISHNTVEITIDTSDFSFMTLEHINHLSWEEIISLNFDLITEEDRCIRSAIGFLNRMGNLVRETSYCMGHIQLDAKNLDIDRLEEKIKLLLQKYNQSSSTYWRANFEKITISSSKSASFSFMIEEWNLMHTPEKIGVNVISATTTKCYPLAEHFGSVVNSEDEINFIQPKDIIVVTGVTYLNEMGEIDKSRDSIYIPYEDLANLEGDIPIENSVYRMLHLSKLNGEPLGYAMPSSVIP